MEEFCKAAQGVLDATADGAKPAGADAQRKSFAVEVMRARAAWRERLCGQEEKRLAVAALGERVAEEEAAVEAAQEALAAVRLLVQVRRDAFAKAKDLGGKLAVSEEEFLAEHRVEGEGELSLLRRRIDHEVQLKDDCQKQFKALVSQGAKMKAELKELRKLFAASVDPLNDLSSKIQAVQQSVGVAPDAASAMLPASLPVALYRAQRCLSDCLGAGSVRVVQAKEAKKPKAGDKKKVLSPFAVEATLLERDDSPSIRVYFAMAGQELRVECRGFLPSILTREPLTAMDFGDEKVEVAAVPWISELQRAELVGEGADMAYDTRELTLQLGNLVKEMQYHDDLSAIFTILSSGKNALELTNIVEIVQKYLPSYPAPRVSVTDVLLGAEEPRERKRPREEREGRLVQFKIELDHLVYTIAGTVADGYPNPPPHFKLKVRDTSGAAGYMVPAAVLKQAVQLAGGEGQSAVGSKRFVMFDEEVDEKKNTRSSGGTDYTTQTVDAGFADEAVEHFSKVVNSDCILQTPMHRKGHVLMRQILTAIFFVQAYHPYLLRKGVAGMYTAEDFPAAEAALRFHSPAEARLLHHNTQPLHRGRVVQLPLQWDTTYLRWTHRSAGVGQLSDFSGY